MDVRLGRILVIAALACVGLTQVPSAAAAGFPGASSSGDAVNVEALQQVGACIAGGGEGDMLLLIDRSGSLKGTDPSAARVDAAEYLLRQMTSFVDTTKSSITVAIAGFDAKYQKTTNWTALTPGTAGALDQSLEAYRNQTNGWDTDYWNALDGARRDLASRAATVGRRHCGFLVWFTDGEYSIAPRSQVTDKAALGDPKRYAPSNRLQTQQEAAAAARAGLDDICRPGGLADQVRTQGFANIAVGLSGAAPPDFSALKAIATGQGDRCGRVLQPAPGAFFLASDIDDLFFDFDQFATPGSPPITQAGGICGGSLCADGTHHFVLDASIGSVHILGASTAPDQRVLLVPPGGKPVELVPETGPGFVKVRGATVAWRRVSPQSVSVDLVRKADDGWAGQWGLVFLSPSHAKGTSRSSLHIFGDLAPEWKAAESGVLRAGDQATRLRFGVAHTDDTAVDPAGLSDQTSLSAVVLFPDGRKIPVADGLTRSRIDKPQPLDLSSATPGQAVLRLTLAVTTKAWESHGTRVPGTALEPQVKDYPIEILPPLNYPSVAAKADFGHVETADPVTALVSVRGEGCVWLASAPTVVTLPQGVRAVTLTSRAKDEASCVGGALPLTLTPDAVGNGLVAGNVTVMTSSKQAGAKSIPVKVAFQLDMAKPISKPVLGAVLVLGTLLGVLIPLGLLYLVKFFTARIPGDSVKAGSIRGHVDDTRSFLDEGVDLEPHAMATAFLSNPRHVVVGGTTLRAKTGLALTEPGYVLVDQMGRPAAGGARAARAGDKAKLPLTVQGTWCVALDPTNPRTGEVEVTFYTSPGAAGWADLVEDARVHVREVVSTLRNRLSSGDGTDELRPPPDPWADGGRSNEDSWDAGSTTGESWSGAPTAPANSWNSVPLRTPNQSTETSGRSPQPRPQPPPNPDESW